MARKAAAGSGTIRKKTVTRNGKQYVYWEARYTTGYDPGTGRQIQRSVTGKTQKEVSQKLKKATAAIDAGTYTAPSRMTVGQWLDIWTAEYLGSVKPATAASYKAITNTHLKPALGAVKLQKLDTDTIQTAYNQLNSTLAPKTVKNVHGVLHKALQQAVKNRYISFNPAESCELVRAERKELQPLDGDQISAFLRAISGHQFEELFITALFTGMREGELLGLLWDCVDLKKGTIRINKQLQKIDGEYRLVSTKNGKGRTITLAPFVVSVLKRVKDQQQNSRDQYGEYWTDSGFVFTNDLGLHLNRHTVLKHFKKVMAQLGSPETRFHDLRHSYAVASIRSGDDIKTVQENLGHATAAFTLNVYGHVTDQMKQDSAARMEKFIQTVNKSPIREKPGKQKNPVPETRTSNRIKQLNK